jgi:hypothetical protein
MELVADTSTAIRPAAADIVRTFNSRNVRTIPLEDRMALSASKLRADVYRLLDQVLETGKPLEIERNGKTLLIVPKEKEKKGSKLDNLPQRPGAIIGDPDELIHMDWSSEWNPDPY